MRIDAQMSPAEIKMAGCSGMSIAVNKFEGFKCHANEAIHFKIVRSEKDVHDDSIDFKPDMTHQLFGESESIFGYKDLKVQVFCTAARLKTYINLGYTEKVTPEKFDNLEPDDLLQTLAKEFQPGFYTNQDQFLTSLQKEKSFKPYGEKIHSYKVTKGEEREFEVYKTSIEEPGFRDFHERLQPFLLFYVDAASYIDVDDDRWMYFLLYERYQVDGENMFAFVGYMTIYNYFAYPDKIRPRISQVLVMPPYQKQGHGATLIQTFYDDCFKRPEVLDITVEDPSENFQRVRDFVDAKNCSKLRCFQPMQLAMGFTDSLCKEVRAKLKINRRQARRIYEILRLKNTNCSEPIEYKAYRLEVKKRLNQPFQKNGRDFEKLQRALNTNELTATLNNMSMEQRLEYLEKQYQECLTEYKQVIERLAAST